jgi:transposase-like protein
MKRARFSEEQIIAVLKEAEAGAKVSELCRRHGISDATFSTWRSKYGGLEISEMRRLRPAGRRESTAEVDRGRPGTRHPGVEGRAVKKRLRPAVKREMVAQVIATGLLPEKRHENELESVTERRRTHAGESIQRRADHRDIA